MSKMDDRLEGVPKPLRKISDGALFFMIVAAFFIFMISWIAIEQFFDLEPKLTQRVLLWN